jgi:tetratricopeptide (TPR) repeat protein
MSKSKPATTTGGEAKPSRLRVAAEVLRRLVRWAWTHPWQAGIVAAVVSVPVVPIVVVLLTLRLQYAAEERTRTLSDALAALDRRDDAAAEDIAAHLGGVDPLPADELGGRPFVLGVVTDRRASRALDRSKRRYEVLAAKYLEEAQSLGFPPGREGEGLRLLGKNLYLSGQSTASLPVLQAALPLDPQHQSELHRLLAAAYVAEPKPKFKEALVHAERYLADKKLTVAERQEGLLERGRIELGLKDFEACRKTLEQIPASSQFQAEATLLRGRLLSEQVQALPAPAGDALDPARKTAYQQAIETLRAAQTRDAPAPTAAASKFLIGRCEVGLGDDQAALGEFDHALQRYLETDAGIAAGFEAAELLRRQNRNAEALERYRTALGSIDRTQSFRNSWVAADELRARALDTYHQFLKAKQFDLAIELAGLLEPLFSADRSIQLSADAHRQWGQDLTAQAATAPAPEAAELEAQACRKLREAGPLYAELAKSRIATREYPDDLYAAAESFLAGHDYVSASDVFRKYLAAESRRRRPRALIGLGEALLARDRPAEALVSLEECIEFHARDASVFEARLLASQARLELGDVKAAEALLLANLDGEALTPASQEWRNSLFALGRLLYQTDRYADAIQRLEEAVARYPALPQSIEARYLVAEAYRRRAQQVQQQAAAEATAEGRLSHERQADQLLESALSTYDLQRDALLAQQGQRPLSELEESILRNCFFSRGTVLFELGRYREAIDAYSSATNRYHRHPEVLQAYVQIAACYRRLGQPVEARSTLEQAKYALQHMPGGAAVDGTTNYNREEWNRLLDTLDTL